MYKEIEPIPPNRTVIFKTILQDDNHIVRTGTISDGSCAFHSLLHSYSSEYMTSNVKDRKIIVRTLRKTIAGSISKDDWKALNDGMTATVSIQENLNTVLESLSSLLSADKLSTTDTDTDIQDVIEACHLEKDKQFNIYKLIVNMVDFFDTMTNQIIPKMSDTTTVDNCVNEWIVIFKHKLNGNLEYENLSSTKQRFLCRLVTTLCESIYKLVETIAYGSFIESISDPAVYVDTNLLTIIASWFDRNIYIIEDSSRLPYVFSSRIEPDRPYIVLLWVGGEHYEILGELTANKQIKREFNENDTFIRKITLFLESKKLD